MAERRRGGLANLRLALLPGRKSVLLKTLLAYIAIGSLLIASMSVVLYGKFSSTSIQQINQTSMDGLYQSMNTFDRLWTSLYLTMNREFQTDSVMIEGLNLDAYSPIPSSRIETVLEGIVNTTSAIESVYLYNSIADTVFSNFGTATSCDSFYDPDIVGLLRDGNIQISKTSDCAIVYRKMRYVYGSLDVAKNAITVIFSSDDLRTALIFNINQELLQNLVVPRNAPKGQSMLILNREGVVISDAQPDLIFQNLSQEPYVRRVLDSGADSGCFTDDVDGRRSLITFGAWNNWETLDWIFVRTADYDVLLGSLRQLQLSVLLITSLFVLAAITIAVVFWGNLFRPFYRLIGIMRSRSPFEPAKMSEIEYLGDVYGNLVQDIESLNRYKNNSHQLLRQDCLYRLVHGDAAAARGVGQQEVALGIALDSPQYRVVVFRLDRAGEVAGPDLPLLMYTARGLIAQNFASLSAEAVESADGCISLVFGVPEKPYDLFRMIKNAQEACSKALNLSFTVGIGTVEEAAAGIALSQRTAMEATAYRLLYGRGAVVDFTAEAVSRQMKYRYPLEMEKELLDAAKSADPERFAATLNAFAGCIESYNYNEILLAFSQMAFILIRTLKAQLEVTHMQEAGIAEDIREVDRTIRCAETLQDVRRWLVNYYEQCVAVIRARRNSRYQETVNSIQHYIEEHFGDPALSVERIADHVGLSPNYMRTLYKDHTGMTVSHFLNELRFRRAAQLLADTDTTIGQIAAMVGFPEGSYFYSAFKNSMGMTPAEYRKSRRHRGEPQTGE